MKKKLNDPFATIVLDEEEQVLENALERGEYEEDPQFEETKKMLEEAALQHTQLQVAKPVTIRIKQLDLIKVKSKAKAKNIPYQTLLGSVIHQYAEGKSSISL